ncbi:MAG: thiamine phosphate synthase [Methylococcales bacterium]|nr:thiamine phosphate synthase [Methylococcales bacterium]
MFAMPKNGLYAITPDGKTAEEILEFTQAVLKGGAKIVQYRFKAHPPLPPFKGGNGSVQFENYQIERNFLPPLEGGGGEVLLAQQLLKLCHTYNVPLIINDNVELADKIGADGVHLGKEDGSISQARARLGEKAIIGVSCYNSLERAVAAEKEGATYVAFGRFFSSTSKPLAAPAQIGTLTAARKILTVPIVAIGGILPENGASLLNAGADLLAVIGGLATENPRLSAQNYCRLFSQ